MVSRFGLLAAIATATVPVLAAVSHADPIVVDNFTNGQSYGPSIVGLSPSGANLPGGAWQEAAYDNYNVNEYTGGSFAGQSNYASAYNGCAAAISLISNGGYTEPSTLNISATLSPNPAGTNTESANTTIYLGFYPQTYTGGNYGVFASTNLLGLAIDYDGNLDEVVNGQSTLIAAAGTGIFDANGFTTLSYQISFDPGTGAATFSNIVLGGNPIAGAYDATDANAAALDFAGFGEGPSQNTGMITHFEVDSVPEPASLGLVAMSAMFCLRRRRRA